MIFRILLFFPLFAAATSGFQEPWGKDSNLKPTKKIEEKEDSFPVKIANAIIRFHQEVISPVDGPRSHYRPTSSTYMKLAMQRYGFIQGFLMGCDRLIRENDEEWVYRKIEIDGKIYKFDPARSHKY
jgi:uncharacterized protein